MKGTSTNFSSGWYDLPWETPFKCSLSLQLSEVSPKPEDLMSAVDMSDSFEELEALAACAREQSIVLRGKDSGGEAGIGVL